MDSNRQYYVSAVHMHWEMFCLPYSIPPTAMVGGGGPVYQRAPSTTKVGEGMKNNDFTLFHKALAVFVVSAM